MAVQAKKYEKANHDKREKIHLLSGILKCPVCGAGMYGNKSIKKRKDGSNYKDFYYYGCKHRNMTRGHKCDYKKQVHEEMLDASVAEVISNPKFSDLIRNKTNMEVDTSALDQEIENYKIKRSAKRRFSDCQKSLAEFFQPSEKINTIVFCGGVYVAENTSHGAKCRIVRLRRTTEAWSEVQTLLSKKA